MAAIEPSTGQVFLHIHDSRYVNVTGDTMTGALTINTNSTTALLVEQTGVKSNVLVVDTTNGRIGIGGAPVSQFNIIADGDADFRLYSYGNTDPAITSYAAGGTKTSPTIISNGNKLFDIIGWGYDGATYRIGTRIISVINGTPAIGASMPADLYFYTTADGSITPGERLRINNNGGIIVTGGADRVQTIIKANATQTANLTEWQDSSATVLAYVEPDGEIVIPQDSKAIKLGAGVDATILYDGTNLVINPKVVGTGFLSVLGDISLLDEDIILGTTTGSQIGTAVGQKLAFHGSTPVVQRTGAAQAAVATTASTQTTPFGYTTAAQADGIITLLNEIRAALVEKGIMKGSA